MFLGFIAREIVNFILIVFFFFTLLCCFYLLTNRSTCKTLVHGIKTLNLWKTKIPDQATIWFGQF